MIHSGRSWRATFALIGAALPLSLASPAQAVTPLYTELDAPPGQGYSNALAISGNRMALAERSGVTIHTLLRTAPGSWVASGDVSPSGSALALSGNRLVVGDAQVNGTVSVWDHTPSGWQLTATLTANDGAAGDQFGFSVAVDGDRILVGAPQQAPAIGKAYLFDRVNGSWQQTAVMTDNVALGFGRSVALSGDRALIGAPYTPLAGLSQAGMAVEYERATGWAQGIELSETPRQEGLYGHSVAISGTRLLIAAPDTIGFEFRPVHGKAHLYDLVGASFQETVDLGTLVSPRVYGFAESVALQGERAVVGRPFLGDVIPSNTSGDALVFTHGASGWQLSADLTSPAQGERMEFGRVVALDSGRVLVSNPFAGLPANPVGPGLMEAFELDPAAAPAPWGSSLLVVVLALSLFGAGTLLARRLAAG